MLQQFNAANSGKAIQSGSNLSGYIVVQGAAPFWVGQTRQGLEGLMGPPPGGFNQEVRDGIYIDPSKIPGGVLWLPWSGDLWIMNGTGPLDNPTNWVVIGVMPCNS